MKRALRCLLVASLAFGTAAVTEMVTASQAQAVDSYSVNFSGKTAPDGVNVRTGPGTGYPVAKSLGGNVTVNFNGLEYGSIVPDVWENKPDPRWYWFWENGRKLYVASAVVNGNPPASGIRAKDRAVAWAVANQFRTDYSWYCQKFVENAYGTGGIYPSAIAASNALNTGGSLGSAPIGSLVFFAPAADNGYYGHVGIYIGENTMISGVATVKAENIATSSYWSSRYTGWGYAPASWPGHY